MFQQEVYDHFNDVQFLKKGKKKKKNGMNYSLKYKKEFPELGKELRTSDQSMNYLKAGAKDLPVYEEGKSLASSCFIR